MITKSDALTLLFKLKEEGIVVDKYLNMLLTSVDLPIEVIKFINNNRELNLTKFYEKVRHSYNTKHSTLYKGIVRESVEDPKDILTTLASLQLQILLFNKQINDNMFLKHARLEDISKVLLNYARTGDIIPCQKLLNIIKTDLKCCESFKKEEEE